jgi:hypothetical protein
MGEWVDKEWVGIKDKGKRITGEREHKERMLLCVSAFIPYPFSFLPFIHFPCVYRESGRCPHILPDV